MSRMPTLLLIVCAVVPALVVAAEPSRNDAAALQHLFAEEQLENITLDLRKKGLALTPHQRFEFLRKWLLPHETQPNWRLPFDFAPTEPSPPVQKTLKISLEGGDFLSPVYDLIETARIIGRLDALEEQIERYDTSDSRDDRRAQLAWLVLIAVERHDASRIGERFDRFLQEFESGAVADPAQTPSPAEWLLVSKCTAIEPLRPRVAECVFRYLTWASDSRRRNIEQRHWGRFVADLRPVIENRDAAAVQNPFAGSQWFPARHATSHTNGIGCPPSAWVAGKGFVENIVSHNDDFLFFAVPMRGEYTVECDLSGSRWLDSQVSLHGTWVAPTYERDALLVGGFRRAATKIGLPVRLTSWARATWLGWTHFRAVVDGETSRHYLSGRLVHQHSLSPDADPWLGLRSSYWRAGTVRNLSISGNPTVPGQIDMLADSELNSWVGYFGESVGSPISDWKMEANELHAAALVPSDPYHPSADGHVESLLRYHRPLCEDGTITYEFYYEPGTIEVDPAIGRMVLRLDPGGVKLHWLTDGRDDRTELGPGNLTDADEHRTIEGALPLKPGDWNQLSLDVEGDLVTVVLNGQRVFSRPLEAGNSRTFGLFRYADKSSVRVRKMIHRGDWPRKLPAIEEQSLASDEVLKLNREAEQLKDHFTHRFDAGDVWGTKFALTAGSFENNISLTETGLKTYREGTNEYNDTKIAARVTVHGDFDIVAEYVDFSAIAAKEGFGSARLAIEPQTEFPSSFSIRRTHTDHKEGLLHLFQCTSAKKTPERSIHDWFASGPMEETFGKLRFARRGETLYFLTAENDSPNFQLRGTRDITRDDLTEGSVMLTQQTHKPGSVCSVTWKSLSIRAERLSGPAMDQASEE